MLCNLKLSTTTILAKKFFRLENIALRKIFTNSSLLRMTDHNNNNVIEDKNNDENQPDDQIDRLATILKLFGLNRPDPHKIEKKLKSIDLNGFVEHIKQSNNIIFMNGAGISTSAGIPDFRSPKTGLYANLDKYQLPDPHMIFDIGFFKTNPQPFFSLSKELMPADYKPTTAHYFQRLMVDKGKVLKIYTQNIDGLESMTNIPKDKIIHAHGSFKQGHCLACRKEYPFEWMKKNIHEKEYLKCEDEECVKSSQRDDLKIVKPDITFFGEEMPKEFFNYPQDYAKCDCLIVIGTSLKVYPFSSLVNYVNDECPRLLINREKVGDWAVYDRDEDEAKLNYRDVFLQGDCDDACRQLAKLLGYEDQLQNLIKTETENFKS